MDNEALKTRMPVLPEGMFWKIVAIPNQTCCIEVIVAKEPTETESWIRVDSQHLDLNDVPTEEDCIRTIVEVAESLKARADHANMVYNFEGEYR